MKLLGEVLRLSMQYLQEKNVTAPRLVAETLLSYSLGVKRLDLYMQFECPLQEPELAKFRSLLQRAAKQEPVEYILAKVDFYGLELPVTSDVLIPRPETEILVDRAAHILGLEDLKGKVLWDLCSGSGCIGLSLKKKFPDLSVSLSDLSEPAIAVAQKAAKANQLEVDFLQGDLFSPFEGKKAHYIFCNPPYISAQEYEELSFSVKGFEPKSALVGGVTGLEFYERLALQLPYYTSPGAKVFLEIGYLQGKAVNEIFSDSCWIQKRLEQDWSGKDRFFFLERE
ncbi:MAG: peptide chain release factor N(5)-glutamine methyltransferase [Rhabdochlamydiaceae bacterium]|nr:peptide chain release factor N(5)-glutamine methyltransferase [Rhabdochlamydiaceae bacterium]